MKIGYARSSVASGLERQEAMLKEAGCEVIYSEVAASSDERPQLTKAIEKAAEAGVLLVCTIDRLSRYPVSLLNIGYRLSKQGTRLTSCKEGIEEENPLSVTMLPLLQKIIPPDLLRRDPEFIFKAMKLILGHLEQHGSISEEIAVEIVRSLK